MSPTKKKTAKKKTAAKKTAKKAAKKTAKKAAKKTAKKAAKKTAAKKASKKAAAKKASKKVPAKKAAKKAPAKAASKKAAPAKKAAAKKAPAKGKKAAAKPAKAAPKGKPIPLSDVPHPKYGLKFECFSCETRFYMMGRPDPVCPKCGADQRERPKEAPKETPKVKRPAVRPMAPLLDDDEEVTPRDEPETKPVREPAEPDAMFDDAEQASATEEVEVEAPAATDDD